MPFKINHELIFIENDSSVRIADEKLAHSIRKSQESSQERSLLFSENPNIRCNNSGECAGEKNLGNCINTGTCIF